MVSRVMDAANKKMKNENKEMHTNKGWKPIGKTISVESFVEIYVWVWK